MRDKDIENRFIEVEKRLDALEKVYLGVDLAKGKDKSVVNGKPIEPINTPEGTRQRDEIREKLAKKADAEEKKSSKDIKKVVANILDEGGKSEKEVKNE